MNEPVRRLQVVRSDERSRYEAEVEGGTAFAQFTREGETLIFTHTEVPAAQEGRGVGTDLVRQALEDARAEGWRVMPLCRFVRAFVQRHPEFGDLVVDGA